MSDIIFPRELPKMKVIDMSDPASAKAYLTRPVEDTHSQSELEAVHRAIRFTNAFRKKEAQEKMNEEGAMELPIPDQKFLRSI